MADKGRGHVVSSSLLTAAAGILPVPVMDDVVAALLRARMLKKIADRRQVDVTRDALAILSDEPQVSRLRHMALTGVTLIALRKAWRKMFLVLAVGRRTEEFTHSFELGTLFDHYCARHHVGAAVDTDTAARLRAAFLQIGRDVRKGAVGGAARRVFSRSSGADLATRDPRPAIVDESLFEKVQRVLDDELGRAGDAYVEALKAAFDRTWKKP